MTSETLSPQWSSRSLRFSQSIFHPQCMAIQSSTPFKCRQTKYALHARVCVCVCVCLCVPKHEFETCSNCEVRHSNIPAMRQRLYACMHTCMFVHMHVSIDVCRVGARAGQGRAVAKPVALVHGTPYLQKFGIIAQDCVRRQGTLRQRFHFSSLKESGGRSRDALERRGRCVETGQRLLLPLRVSLSRHAGPCLARLGRPFRRTRSQMTADSPETPLQ